MSQQWPHHVVYALDMLMKYHPPDDVQYMTQFQARWGEPSQETLLLVLRETDKMVDRLFVALALGYLATEQAQTYLLPLLRSEEIFERWASAIGLGKMRVPDAMPALVTMLTESLPPAGDYNQWRYYWSWRMDAPWILGDWGNRAVVPALRHALGEVIRVENRLGELEEKGEVASDRDDWRAYADAIVYNLGRLNALGVLTGMSAVSPQLDLWRVHLIMGHLHGRYPVRSMTLWEPHPDLYQEVARLLEQCFGLTQVERENAMKQYEISMSFEIYALYEHERMRTDGDPY